MPTPTHSQHTAITATREAINRAQTIIGLLLAKATAVATSTTGLTAGAASRKARAAPWGSPLRIKDCDTGTEAHSQPGSTMPATLAAGTASNGDLGVIRDSTSFGTKAAIAPDTSTPSTRNGRACTTIPMVSVPQVAALPWSRSSGPRETVR